jgi:alkylhydroperoxidase family enzyme
MNGCAYCIDMHAKDLRAAGVAEQRLDLLPAFREAPVYSDRERAALAWAEAVTELGKDAVPDALFEEVRKHFEDAELVELTLAVGVINTWNRMNVAFRTPAGSYVPPKAR